MNTGRKREERRGKEEEKMNEHRKEGKRNEGTQMGKRG